MRTMKTFGCEYMNLGTDSFYTYLLDSSGIQAPVISEVGRSVSGFNNKEIGYLRASLDGKRIAAAHVINITQSVEVFDFDNSTGIISNPIEITNFGPANIPYGVEFSPNGDILYVTDYSVASSNDYGQLHQYDLLAGNEVAINNSKLIVDSFPGPGGALIMGPDFKIYQTEINKDSLSVIDNPNVLGLGCNHQKYSLNINVSGQKLKHGLPNFINDIYGTRAKFWNTNVCQNDSSVFEINSPYLLDSVHWDFGDLGSGPNNFSTDLSPKHLFSTDGNFTVTLIVYYNSVSDNIVNTITQSALPIVTTTPFSPDSICQYDLPYNLSNGSPSGGFYSGNGVTGNVFNPSLVPGNYYIAYSYADSNGCVNSDSTLMKLYICAGIEEANLLQNLKIYPNPNSGIFTIQKPSNLNQNLEIKILDMNSKLILEKTMTPNQAKFEIDISKYSDGIYYLQLKTNNELTTKQILKTN